GGSDSLALTLLAADWAERRGGQAVALTVDHGLRAESAAEARQVARWLKARGVAHRTLRWAGPKPASNVAARARDARYGLMTGWCRAHGILELLLAHQREDQAETFLLRLARGSGVDGLAAMAPVAEQNGIRLLRPLLDVPRARLQATLKRLRQPWIEDPSNADLVYARSRMRALMPALAAEGLTVERLTATAAHMARARHALERATVWLLQSAAQIQDAGYVLLRAATLIAAPEEIALRALARLLMAVGGASVTPRLARLETLLAEFAPAGLARGRTLGGCRLLPLPGGRVLICREPAAVAPPVPIEPGSSLFWDGRFALSVPRGLKLPRRGRGLRVGALGRDGWREVAERRPDVADLGLAEPVRLTIPALTDLDGVLAVPHLTYMRAPPAASTLPRSADPALVARFEPRRLWLGTASRPLPDVEGAPC
ncbi:MAG TPA: tRNA lysidine(34) synthetase TilS, partial [Candidatus Cybelea sp.]|nr:tRNA lysidine(34) synthetase TilS [Candidatus Cybelea sp.]